MEGSEVTTLESEMLDWLSGAVSERSVVPVLGVSETCALVDVVLGYLVPGDAECMTACEVDDEPRVLCFPELVLEAGMEASAEELKYETLDVNVRPDVNAPPISALPESVPLDRVELAEFVDVVLGNLVPGDDESVTSCVLEDDSRVPCSPEPVLEIWEEATTEDFKSGTLAVNVGPGVDALPSPALLKIVPADWLEVV